MGTDVYPCIIYQRLRPSAPEASEYARKTVWPLADELVAHEGYTLCGRYGDSEFAPKFCGGSEIRPGFELALRHAKKIAGEIGTCALLVGDASSIGDGDPFMPIYEPSDLNGLDIRLVNFHLRSHARSTNLRAAWRYFEYYRVAELRSRPSIIPIEFPAPTSEIQIVVRRDPEHLLVDLYVTSPMPTPITLKWKQLMRQQGQNAPGVQNVDWRSLVIPGRSGAHVDTVFQGELPWVRQLRFKYEPAGRRMIGSVHLTPSDMTHDCIPLVWEDLW